MIECTDCEEYLKAIDKLEAERDALLSRLARIEEVTRDSGIGPAAAANNLARLAPAPPADAATEDAVTAWARLAVALLARHESAWDHDPGPGDDDCDEDCRACEYMALLRTGRAALSSPAPAPSAPAMPEEAKP